MFGNNTNSQTLLSLFSDDVSSLDDSSSNDSKKLRSKFINKRSIMSTKSKNRSDQAINNSRSKNSLKKRGFSEIGLVLNKYTLKDKGGYITKEFQDYGYRLGVTLNDLKHKSLYIKMAKTIDRGILERALAFVIDANTAKSKARLFMWKVKRLREEKDYKEKNNGQ